MATKLFCNCGVINLSPKSVFRFKLCIITLLLIDFINPVVSKTERITAIDVQTLEKTANKRLTAGGHSTGTTKINGIDARFWGKLLDLGRENKVDGRLHLVGS